MRAAWSNCDGLEAKKLRFRPGNYLELSLKLWTVRLCFWSGFPNLWNRRSWIWLTSFLRALWLLRGCTSTWGGHGTAGWSGARRGENKNPNSRFGPESGPTLEKGTKTGSTGRGFALTCRLPTTQSAKSSPAASAVTHCHLLQLDARNRPGSIKPTMARQPQRWAKDRVPPPAHPQPPAQAQAQAQALERSDLSRCNLGNGVYAQGGALAGHMTNVPIDAFLTGELRLDVTNEKLALFSSGTTAVMAPPVRYCIPGKWAVPSPSLG
jgi:hypothetical protein